ncbi:glycosyltransferase family 4 protein [Roseateles asaccharophilus]|uniref:Glycosyltransferase involved in cell wall biosynthesis n=1 Tax=Roseateles asaccharophilus TaxID=582607 RepID=A0ABU2ACC1_9BURK|nr:glycosyltransferase family 4 protein [Roseateles asaccharophilus]MDR7334838.1 glycosyltransferase involved in cell wall biosynthesis [Roseateles asaccharophilus]
MKQGEGARVLRNVLFVHQAAEMYGSDKVLLYLVTGLLRRGRYWPIVVVPEEGPLVDALRGAGVEVHVCEIAKVKRAVFTPRGFLRLFAQMRAAVVDYDRVVAGRKIGLVHSNTLAVLGGAAWAWRRGVRHLWHVHEIILSPKLVSKAFPWLVKLASDKVVSNSTLTERWLVSHQPALQDRSVVVFNGLPPQEEVLPDAVQAFRVLTGARAGHQLVVLAGRLNHWKGQGLLIEAAARLQARGQLSGLHFAIVGDTAPGQEALRTALMKQVADAGLVECFSFVPFVSDIRPVWLAADIAVVPSTEPEPFGMVAIEAMAAGVPVIVAAHGGLLDIVEHGLSGLHFTPRDAGALADTLHRLATDQNLRSQLGSQGQQRQQRCFSAESQIESLERVYDDMLAQGR